MTSNSTLWKRPKVLLIEQRPTPELLDSGKSIWHDPEIFCFTQAEDVMNFLETNNKPDAIFCGVELLDGSGMELIEKISKNYMPRFPIALIRGQRPIGLDVAHDFGATHLFEKPLRAEHFDEINQYVSLENERRSSGRIALPANEGDKFFGLKTIFCNEKFCAEISNIGRGGFFFKNPGKPDSLPVIDSIMEFELTLSLYPDQQIHGTGRVRWIQGNGVGVEFLNLDGDGFDLIRSFVELFRVRSFVPSGYRR